MQQSPAFYQAHLARLESLQTALCSNHSSYVAHLNELEAIIAQLRATAASAPAPCPCFVCTGNNKAEVAHA